ncbi:hypothetical protein IW261DRAFT_1592403 [Armillaria novae-zelandiae]|uniref:F-box domain-containing protein n=1 Tax=Armillaria novae-zelandiae TaxID=153914 RepID=A0AA39PF94_9AGAR|nr:hypothetical protein IW261DRAFT_1592403 [Armillaria novae-zelandiae]
MKTAQQVTLTLIIANSACPHCWGTMKDTSQVHRQKSRNPTLTFDLRLRQPETEDRVAALVPPPCYRHNETRTRVLHPTARHGTIFPAALAALKYPVDNKTLFLPPPNSRRTMKFRNVRDILRRRHLSSHSPNIVAIEPPVFPLEIFELIIDSVVGVEALHSCALVCRLWYLRARRNIFRVVSLYEKKYKDIEDLEGAERLQLQWKRVRVACPFSLIQDVSVVWEFAGTLVPCASSFTRLKKLKLYSSDVGHHYPGAPEIRSASQLLHALPISHLEISASYFATFQLFLSLWDSSYPSLKHLKISLISIQDMHSRFRSVIIDQANEIMRSYDTIHISERTMLESLELWENMPCASAIAVFLLHPNCPIHVGKLKTFKLHSDLITGHGLASIFVDILSSSINCLAVSCSDEDLFIDTQHLPALTRLTLTVVLTAEALLRVVDIITKVQSTLEHLILKLRQPWEGHEHLHWREWRALDLCLADSESSIRQVEVASEMRDSDLKVLIPLTAECRNIRML